MAATMAGRWACPKAALRAAQIVEQKACSWAESSDAQWVAATESWWVDCWAGCLVWRMADPRDDLTVECLAERWAVSMVFCWAVNWADMKVCQLVVWMVSRKAVSKGNVWVASTAEMMAAL